MNTQKTIVSSKKDAAAGSENKNALIINLTRFGDLIQSQPVLTKIKNLGFTTHLVCLDNFASAAGLLRDVDRIFAFPGARFLAVLDRSWPEAVKEFQDWVDLTSGGRCFDMAVNLTATLSSRLLAGQYMVPDNRGFFLDEHGFGCYSGNWAAFLQASSSHRGCSPFNIVDTFVRAAELNPSNTKISIYNPSDNLVSDMSRRLAHASNGRNFSGFITFQLGASEDRRRWPVAFFASLGDMLNNKLNLCPVLLGTDNEKPLTDKYASLSHTFHINLAGSTNLQELSAMLTLSKLLVTNDTGTMHLAAGLGVKSLSFFLATAQPWDTGPYLQDCLCLEPGVDCHPCSFSHQCQENHSCRQSIQPDFVFRAIEHFIAGKGWPEIKTSQAKIRKTCFENDFFSLKSMNTKAEDDYARWLRIQKHYYSLFLDQIPVHPVSGIAQPSKQFREMIIEHINSIAPLLNLAGEQANVLKKIAVPAVKKKFLTTWQRLSHELSHSPYLPVLGLLWTYQTQDASSDLERISRICSAYSSLLLGVRDFLAQE